MGDLTVSNYLGMLQDDPNDRSAIEGLRRLLQDNSASPKQYVRLLETARGQHERLGEFRATAWLMEIEASLLDEHDSFRDVLYKELARIRRDELMDDAGALELLRGLNANGSRDAELSQQIEKLDQAGAKWQDIAKRFAEEARECSDVRLKTSLFVRAASLIHQHAGVKRRKESDRLFEEAIKADPTSAHAPRLYTLSLAERERWKDVAQVCEHAAKSTEDQDDVVGFWLHAARAHARRLDDDARGAQCYQYALSLQPNNDQALRFLADHYSENESWDELVGVYDRALRHQRSPESEQGMLTQLAMVHWRILEDGQAAEPYFARLRKLDPAHPGMIDFYLERFGESDPEGKLLTVLADAQRAADDPDDQLRFARELAKRAEPAGEPERTAEALRTVQRLSPSDESAASSLRATYRSAGQWNELADLIRQEHDALPQDATQERLARQRELLPIYRNELLSDEMVTNTLSVIVELDPNDLDALAELADAYEDKGRWNELTHVVQAQAEAVQDNEQKVSLWRKASKLWGNRFSNADKAAEALEKVAAAASDDDAEALEELVQLYEKTKNWEALADVLLRQAERAQDVTTKTELQLRAAEVYSDRLHKHGDAIDLLKQAVDASETADVQTLTTLESLSEQARDWDTLATTLKKRLDPITDDTQRRPILMRLGDVLLKYQDDVEGAEAIWTQVQAGDPMNVSAAMALRTIYVRKHDWDALETMHEESGDWGSLVATLEQAAQTSDNDEIKRALWNRAGIVKAEKLRDAEGAIATFKHALTLGGHTRETIEVLLPLYEGRQNVTGVAKLLAELQSQFGGDEIEARADTLARLGSIYLNELDDPKQAYVWAGEAFSLAPQLESNAAALEVSAEAASMVSQAVVRFEQRLGENDVGEEERLDLRRRIARMACGGLGETEQAAAQFHQILSERPTDEEAIATLDSLYRSSGRHGDLRALYDHRLAHTSQSAHKRTLLKEVAHLEANQLGDSQAAAARYEAMLQDDGDDLDALRALSHCYQHLKEWRPLANVVERQIDLESGPESKLSAWLSLVDLRRLYLNDAEGATDAYLQALQIDAGDTVALMGLQSMAATDPDDPDLNLRVRPALHAGYTKNNDVANLASLLKQELAETTDESKRTELNLKLAEISDSAGAYEVLEAAFNNDPTDASLLARLCQTGEAASLHVRLAQTLNQAFERLEDGQQNKEELALHLAKLHDEVLGDPEAALKFYQYGFDHDPNNDDAFSALKQHCTNVEAWQQLRELYQTRIEQTFDVQAKLDLLHQLCFLFEEILNEPVEAISAYEQAIELDPSHLPSRRALERLYRRTERWPQLVNILRRVVDEAQGQEAVDGWYELGELHEGHVPDLEAAVDAYERVLELSATHLRAQEKLATLANEPSQRHRVIQILEPIYESQGAWSELAKIVELQTEDLKDPVSTSAMLGRLAGVYESKLRDIDKAFDAVARAVISDPADTHNREELNRLATLRSAHRARADVLERSLEAKPDEYVQTEILVELAEIWDDLDDDKDRAKSAYTRLLEHESHNKEVVLGASRALARLNRQTQDVQRTQPRARSADRVRGRRWRSR